jgi:Rap1a immunity proteins
VQSYFKATCLSFSLLGTAVPVQAEIVANKKTGNGLFSLCRSDEFSREMTACYSYIEGTLDGWLTSENTFNHEPGFCIPQGVTLMQLRDSFVRWLENNPERRHEEGSVLIVDSVIHAFPCAE